MANQKLNAQTRDVLGRRVKALRKDGILPANIFGKKVKSLAVQVKETEFMKVFGSVGETSLVDLQISSGKSKSQGKTVLITNVQFDPVTDNPLHVDFHQVDLKEKVTAQVPVEVVGESPAEKQGLGTAVVYVDEVEVEALPTDLPDKFEVNLSILAEVDQTILVKDLDYDKKKVEVKVELEEVVVKVEPLREEEEEPAPTEEVDEGEEQAEEEEEGKEEGGDVVESEKEEEKSEEATEAKRPEKPSN